MYYAEVTYSSIDWEASEQEVEAKELPTQYHTVGINVDDASKVADITELGIKALEEEHGYDIVYASMSRISIED